MLGYASYHDFQTREIHDKVWVVFGAFGFLINVYELYLGTLNLYNLAIPLIFISIMGFLMNYFSLFGEADILALVTTVFIQPQPPYFVNQSLGWHPFFYAFTILSNTALVGVLSAFLTLSKNLRLMIQGEDLFQTMPDLSLFNKILLLVIGTSVKPRNIKGPPFQYPLESPEYSEELSLRPDFNDDAEAKRIFNRLRVSGKTRVWVSATLPYVNIIFLGYLASISIGDILFRFLILLFYG